MPGDIAEPGHFELDLVHHSGPQTHSDYICTMQWIDVCTGWSERSAWPAAAIYGRSAAEVCAAVERIIARCPIPIRQVHPDNGSEFLNHPLLALLRERLVGVRITRSRPWQKNDNAHVEQKNYTLVHAYTGHERFDTRAQRDLLNALWAKLRLYNNLFQPVLRQKSKTYQTDAQGQVHLQRIYGPARTPLQRLLDTEVLGAEEAARWKALYARTNPLVLRRDIQATLDALCATLPA
jgi:hypothetical protein